MFAHKYFRRKVSEHPDFLIKVKNLYIPVTKSGTDYTDYTDYTDLSLMSIKTHS